MSMRLVYACMPDETLCVLFRCFPHFIQARELSAPEVWKACLSKCEEVLEASAAVFSSVQETNVLKEIVTSEEGRNKLRGCSLDLHVLLLLVMEVVIGLRHFTLCKHRL